MADARHVRKPLVTTRLALADVLPPCADDVGILALGILAAFFGAFVAFLRYDVR